MNSRLISNLGGVTSRAVRGVGDRLRHPVSQQTWTMALHGLVGGLYLLTWSLMVMCLVGTSQPASTAMCVALGLGMLLGARGAVPYRLPRLDAAQQLALQHFALAALAVLAPWVLEFANGFLGRAGMISLESPGWNSLVLCGLALFLLGLPAALVSALPLHVQAYLQQKSWAGTAGEGTSRRPLPFRLPVFLAGIAAGWVVGGYVLFPWLGTLNTALAAALIGAGLAVAALLAGDAAPLAAESQTGSHSENMALLQSDEQFAAPGGAGNSLSGVGIEAVPAWGTLTEMALAACLGGLLAGCLSVVRQLTPVTSYAWCAEVISLVLGCAAGLVCLQRADRRAGGRSEFARLWCCGGAALCASLLLVAFPLLVQASLWLSASVSLTGGLLAGRGGLTALGLFPIGLGWAACAVRGTRVAASTTVEQLPQSGLSLATWQMAFTSSTLGYLLAAGCLLPHWGAEGVITLFAWGVAGLAGLRWLPRVVRQVAWRGRLALSGCLSLLAALCLFGDNFDPGLSAKTLFSTNVFIAYRNGFDLGLLTDLDEGRQIERIEGDRGTYTVWKYGGNQLRIRENGIPKGVISTNRAAFPQFAAELLPVAYSLILHEQPQSLLLLGLGSSTSLDASLIFPLQRVVCAEPDAGLVRVVQETIAREAGPTGLQDERVSLLAVDPVLALSGARQQFDVILSTPDQGALLQAQAHLTREFYQRAAERLRADGIFCQRVQTIDLGPDPLRALTRTVQSVFRDVMVVDVSPGEMCLLATNSDQGLVRPGLIERAQMMHVRSLLAQAGLDWSVLLNLAAYQHKDLTDFVADVPVATNTIANGLLAATLPREVMAWGPKQQQMQAALQPRTGRLLDWMGAEAEGTEILRRLAEVKGQQELMVKYADQYWAYRASVKEQVTSRPRSLVQQVSASNSFRGLHPEDQHRLRYFTALGKAVKSRQPDDIHALERFESPYDPLLSYFVHNEAAELYTQAIGKRTPLELQHRLYAIYFASPRTQSLRNVIEALKLLREHPQVEPDARQRWDVTNALLQMLQTRWEARAGTPPTQAAQQVIADIDATIVAAERVFETMEALTAEAELPADLWERRRRILDKTLIRPLQAYRVEVLPHQKREQRLQDRSAGIESAAELGSEFDFPTEAEESVIVPAVGQE